MFGKFEILLPAIKLVELPGIFVDTSLQDIEYFHLLFDQHEIIFAEAAPHRKLINRARIAQISGCGHKTRNSGNFSGNF